MNTEAGIRQGRVLWVGKGGAKKARRPLGPHEGRASVGIKWGVEKVSDYGILPRRLLPGQWNVFVLELPIGRGLVLSERAWLRTSTRLVISWEQPRRSTACLHRKVMAIPGQRLGLPVTSAPLSGMPEDGNPGAVCQRTTEGRNLTPAQRRAPHPSETPI